MTTLETLSNPKLTNVDHLTIASTRLSKKFDKSVSMLSWAYNEEESIEDFLKRSTKILEATVDDWEIIIVNDGSTDRTAEIINQFAKKEPRVVPIHNSTNLNVGNSCKIAISAANKEYLFWQTVDWSYDITNLRIFLELLLYYDVVQGVRPTPVRLFSYIPGIKSLYRIKTRSDSFSKAIVSLSNYYILKILFGLNFFDFQNVTFYPRKLIQSFKLTGKTSFLNPECLIRAYFEKHATFIEVPIPFIPRTKGEAKGTRFTTVIKSVIDVFSNWASWGIKYRSQLLGKDTQKYRIHRVSDPFSISDEVQPFLTILLKHFK